MLCTQFFSNNMCKTYITWHRNAHLVYILECTIISYWIRLELGSIHFSSPQAQSYSNIKLHPSGMKEWEGKRDQSHQHRQTILHFPSIIADPETECMTGNVCCISPTEKKGHFTWAPEGSAIHIHLSPFCHILPAWWQLMQIPPNTKHVLGCADTTQMWSALRSGTLSKVTRNNIK